MGGGGVYMKLRHLLTSSPRIKCSFMLIQVTILPVSPVDLDWYFLVSSVDVPEDCTHIVHADIIFLAAQIVYNHSNLTVSILTMAEQQQ